MLKSKLIFLVFALLGLAVTAERAAAHATSIGFENAGAPGAVNIWLGTYNHGTSSHHLEGSMNLVGVNGNLFPSTTTAFTLGAGVGPAPFSGTPKPAGLIDGTTNFYGCNSTGPLTSTCTGSASSFGQPDHWQGALFTGLGAGDYQFTWTPIANPTAEWSLLNPNMNGIFTLGGIVIGNCGGPNQPPCATPSPASLPLLGLGLIGLVASLKRRQKKAA
jgi:hypothetical protein